MHTALRRLSQITAVVLSAAVLAPLSSTLAAQMLAPQADTTVQLLAPATSPVAAAASPATAMDTSTVRSGAPVAGLRSGVHMRETARPLAPTVAATHASLGQAKALMIVGAAALITGAIIGGDPGTIIMVGGAVIGLYGLYQYLQ